MKIGEALSVSKRMVNKLRADVNKRDRKMEELERQQLQLQFYYIYYISHNCKLQYRACNLVALGVTFL